MRRALQSAAILAGAIVCLGGCQRKSLAGGSDSGVEPQGPRSSSLPTAVADAGPIVDLLHTVEATVALSSKVDNPRDFPEFLVDGKASTAWNGKTGDLTGWIAFRVPASARVLRVEITSGFDKVAASGDLFTMNHRIKRVRIARQGAVIREATLDIEARGLQAIDLDAPGGDFRVDVLETVPGTQAAWRELTVSEFRVWGRAGGAPDNPRHIPRMAIGSLDGATPAKVVSSTTPRGPLASIAELCAANDRVIVPLLVGTFGEDAFSGTASRCKKGDQLGLLPDAFKVGPFQDAAFVEIDDVEQHHTELLIKTVKGWVRTEVRARSRYHMDPGCMHGVANRFEDVTFMKDSTGHDVAVMRLVQRDVQ